MLCCPNGFEAEAKHEVQQAILDEIRRDVPRTFPDNKLISNESGKRALGWILYEVAEHFPEIGYCQVIRSIFPNAKNLEKFRKI